MLRPIRLCQRDWGIRIRDVLKQLALAAFLTAGTGATALGDAIWPVSPAAGAPSWSGLYAGFAAGARRAEADWRTTCFSTACIDGGPNFFFVDASSPRGFDLGSFRGAIFAGHNWQVGDRLAGIEFDFGWSRAARATFGIPGCTFDCGNLPPTPDDIDSASMRALWDASLRLRGGWLLTPRLLAYVTGGVAFQHVTANLVCSFAGPWCFPPGFDDVRDETHRKTLIGWTGGAGLEWMLSGNWLLRGEYRYADFGRFRSTFFAGTADVLLTDIHVVTHTFMIGLAFKH